MDNRSFINKLAQSTETDTKDTSRLVKELVGIIAKCCETNEKVAIPGFGTFEFIKNKEKVITESDGQKVLLPPSLNVLFKAGSRLKKVANHG